ncbi:hypothetical protein ACF08N_35840 [Streptomyces sp. NPDC015127]|uniref:hypothetical protein n=1 Tax=Streptomyces sp. NPDC015127 TaxID=3364939 RepID=UPI0036FE4A4A
MAGVVAVLVSAGVTGIVLAPDDPSGEPLVPRMRPPATVTLIPSSSGRTPDAAVASRPATEPGVKNTPVPGATRQLSRPAPSSKSTSRPGEPEPQRTSRAPDSTPYEPPPPVYDPPPSSTPPPTDGGGGDPFPEETCWDANDCA